MTTRVGQGGISYSDWASLRDHAIELFGETPHPITEQEIIDAYQLHPDAVAKAIDSIAVDVTTGAARSGWGVLRKRATSIAAPPSNPTRATGISREKAVMHAEQWIHAAGIHFNNADEILDELFGTRGQLRTYAQIDLEETPEWQTRTSPAAPNATPISANPPNTTPTPSASSSGQDSTHSPSFSTPLTPSSLQATTNARWQLSEPRGDLALVDRMTKLWLQHRPTGERIEHEALARANTWKQQRKETACRSSSQDSSSEPASDSASPGTSPSSTTITAEPDPVTAPDNDDLPL